MTVATTFAVWLARECRGLFRDDAAVGEAVDAILEVWTVRRVEDDRTLKQNNFFHGPVIDSFVQFTGDTDRDYFKSWLKTKLLSEIRMNGRGKKYLYTKSTKELTKPEFTKFIDDAVQILIDAGGRLVSTAIDEYTELKKV